MPFLSVNFFLSNEICTYLNKRKSDRAPQFPSVQKKNWAVWRCLYGRQPLFCWLILVIFPFPVLNKKSSESRHVHSKPLFDLNPGFEVVCAGSSRLYHKLLRTVFSYPIYTKMAYFLATYSRARLTKIGVNSSFCLRAILVTMKLLVVDTIVIFIRKINFVEARHCLV